MIMCELLSSLYHTRQNVDSQGTSSDMMVSEYEALIEKQIKYINVHHLEPLKELRCKVELLDKKESSLYETLTELINNLSNPVFTSPEIFKEMPDDMVVKIFLHLDKQSLVNGASIVNRRWCRLSVDPALWENYSSSKLCANILKSNVVDKNISVDHKLFHSNFHHKHFNGKLFSFHPASKELLIHDLENPELYATNRRIFGPIDQLYFPSEECPDLFFNTSIGTTFIGVNEDGIFVESNENIYILTLKDDRFYSAMEVIDVGGNAFCQIDGSCILVAYNEVIQSPKPEQIITIKILDTRSQDLLMEVGRLSPSDSHPKIQKGLLTYIDQGVLYIVDYERQETVNTFSLPDEEFIRGYKIDSEAARVFIFSDIDNKLRPVECPESLIYEIKSGSLLSSFTPEFPLHLNRVVFEGSLLFYFKHGWRTKLYVYDLIEGKELTIFFIPHYHSRFHFKPGFFNNKLVYFGQVTYIDYGKIFKCDHSGIAVLDFEPS